MKIRFLGHASFMIETAGKVIYMDPYTLPGGAKKADLILVSNDHYDHCDPKSIEKIIRKRKKRKDKKRKDQTLILTTEKAAKKISGNVRIMDIRDEIDFDGIKIRAIPAYNTGKSFHPKGGGLGFIIESEGKRIYHAGDTDIIPEMGGIEGITVALLPVGGTYTMDVKEAVKAARMINPRIAVPMHYGKLVGSEKDALKFKKLVEEKTSTVTVEILGGMDLKI